MKKGKVYPVKNSEKLRLPRKSFRNTPNTSKISNGVYLVGAGPGAPELITLEGLEYVRKADVIIYDHLVSKEILRLAKSGAEKIPCAKFGKRHKNGFTVEQDKINQLLVKKAKEGKVVVRLKNGDPFIFGRGGQEAESLAQAGIPFKVIPGVTAATAAAASAGIPLTDRRYASVLSLITGHEDSSKKISAIDWKNISAKGTLVFYMGVENLLLIVQKLIQFGRAPDTPVAIIERATLPKEKIVFGNLKNIIRKAKEKNIKPPAIIIVGEVVKLSQKIGG